MDTVPVGEPPQGWVRVADDVRGVPLWKRQAEPFYGLADMPFGR